MRDVCANGHRIRGSMDVFPDGDCRACDRLHGATYRSRRASAVTLARLLEEKHNIPVMRSRPAVDLEALAADLASGYRPEI
jgi:hypothetical protein